MNLAQNPTRDDLRAVLAECNDNAGGHIPQVGHDGEVHLDPVPEDLTPVAFAGQNKDKIKFRLETCQRGNGYVGPAAARDHEWVDRLFKALEDFWKKNAKGYQYYF